MNGEFRVTTPERTNSCGIEVYKKNSWKTTRDSLRNESIRNRFGQKKTLVGLSAEMISPCKEDGRRKESKQVPEM